MGRERIAHYLKRERSVDHMERPAHLSHNSVGCSVGEQSHMRKEAGRETGYHICGPR
jgi:hypothetical protein